MSGLAGSEGDDIFNVTTDQPVMTPDGEVGWVYASIGSDLIEDLGSGYGELIGSHGDDVIISGNYSDVVYGDYDGGSFLQEGRDTFAVYGSGYTKIEDWESGEEIGG